MKNFLNFIVWKWNKWEFWQKCMVGSIPFIFLNVVLPDPYARYTGFIPTVVMLGFTFKWWVWDTAIASYKEYIEERNTLFQQIKESDSK